jgi:hypothetical protein
MRSVSSPAGMANRMNGKGQRGLQQSGLSFADPEQQHRDKGSRRQRDLLGGLRGKVGPGEAVERRWQARGLGSGHGGTPE